MELYMTLMMKFKVQSLKLSMVNLYFLPSKLHDIENIRLFPCHFYVYFNGAVGAVVHGVSSLIALKKEMITDDE